MAWIISCFRRSLYLFLFLYLLSSVDVLTKSQGQYTCDEYLLLNNVSRILSLLLLLHNPHIFLKAKTDRDTDQLSTILGSSTCFLSISINLPLPFYKLRRFLSTHIFNLSTAYAQVAEINMHRCYLMEIDFMAPRTWLGSSLAFGAVCTSSCFCTYFPPLMF